MFRPRPPSPASPSVSPASLSGGRGRLPACDAHQRQPCVTDTCGWATVCKTVRPMPSDRCLSVCLSVCDVRPLWPNGWTDQDETWHAGKPQRWPHCARWGPSSPPQRGTAPRIFGPYLLRPNGCMDQDVTWYGATPRPRPKCSAHVYCGQTAGWIKMVHGMEVGLSPGDFVLDGDLVPSPKRGRSPLPNFRPIPIAVKRLDTSRCHLVWS